jgi:hypothetical protein
LDVCSDRIVAFAVLTIEWKELAINLSAWPHLTGVMMWRLSTTGIGLEIWTGVSDAGAWGANLFWSQRDRREEGQGHHGRFDNLPRRREWPVQRFVAFSQRPGCVITFRWSLG